MMILLLKWQKMGLEDQYDVTWGMMVSLLLSLCKPNLEISTPSIRIRPLAGSISLLEERCFNSIYPGVLILLLSRGKGGVWGKSPV